MATQLMTVNEIEDYIGTDVDKREWERGAYIVASSLRAFLAMIGAGKAGGVGAWALTGVGSLGVGGALLAGAAVLAPLAAFIAALCAIGFPVLEAKLHVSNKAAKQGYAIGLALGLFNHNRYFMSTFLDNTSGSPGIAPSYMTGVYKRAFNGTLLLGYYSASKLDQKDKDKLGKMVLQVMLDDAREKGYELNTSRWSERDGIHHWARTFVNKIDR